VIGVPIDSPRGRELIARGPAWSEDPYSRSDQGWVDPREDCAACGERDCKACGDPQLLDAGIS
jgi:hypothetical protein